MQRCLSACRKLSFFFLDRLNEDQQSKESEEEKEKQAARQRKGLFSTEDYRYTRLHELGTATLVQKHEKAGVDGWGTENQEVVSEALARYRLHKNILLLFWNFPARCRLLLLLRSSQGGVPLP